MTPLHVQGALEVHPDFVVEGWCRAPSRPGQSLGFQILVDDRVVIDGEAALPRADLAAPGAEPAPHGFRAALPAGALDRTGPNLVSARERTGGMVFARRLIEPDEPPPPDARTAAARARIAALSERLAASLPPRRPLEHRWRAACGELATVLATRQGREGDAVAAARALLAAEGPWPDLARPAAPRATLLLPAGGPAPATLARLRALAPATHALAAETVLLDPGADARVALLPSLVPGLRLAPAGDPFALAARGDWLLLLGEAPASAAGLVAAVAALEAADVTLALAGAELPPLPLAVPSGLAFAVRRAALRPSEPLPALLARLRRAGAACVTLAEPWPVSPTGRPIG